MSEPCHVGQSIADALDGNRLELVGSDGPSILNLADLQAHNINVHMGQTGQQLTLCGRFDCAAHNASVNGLASDVADTAPAIQPAVKPDPMAYGS